ncbi:amino acid ABC transporter substrate-binding protein, partial [Rhizobium sp. BUS002]|nr:amino acid ABC transporter substrate-binding protein [Rhizobium phaseoli]
DKWFTQPIPPKNLNLNFKMSEQVKKLIENPSDKPAPDVKI